MTPELERLIQHQRPSVFRAWLKHCWEARFNHGATLATALGTPAEGRAGLTDNNAVADDYLTAAVASGWITRSDRPSPTNAQRFFGTDRHRAQCYGYSPCSLNTEAITFLMGAA